MERAPRKRVQPLRHLHARTDHKQGVAAQPIGGGLVRKLAEGRGHAPLARLPRVQEEGRRRLRGAPISEQLGDARLPPARGKPEHDGLRSAHETDPHRGGPAFDGQGDPAHHRRGELDRHARHRLEVKACALESPGNLSSVGKRVWVAREKHGHFAARAREPDHFVRRYERRNVSRGCGEMKQSSATAIAVANGVGALDRLHRMDRGETWMSRTYPDQHDPAHHPNLPGSTRLG